MRWRFGQPIVRFCFARANSNRVRVFCVRGLWVCEIYDGWRIGWFKKKEKSFRAHIARRRRISLTEGEYRCPKGNIAARRAISLPRKRKYRCTVSAIMLIKKGAAKQRLKYLELPQTEVFKNVVHVLVASAGEVDEHGAVFHFLGKLHAVCDCVRALDGGNDALEP